MMRRLCFQRFCPSVEGGRGKKLKNYQNVMGSPKNALTFFSDFTPFEQGGGGDVLKFEWPYLQEYSSHQSPKLNILEVMAT